MIQLVGGRYYDFDQLGAEFLLSGVSFTSLGTDGFSIFTYDSMGVQTALLPADVAASVIAAHVPSHLERDLVVLAVQPIVGQLLLLVDQTPAVLNLSVPQLALIFVGMAYKLGIIDRTTLEVLPPEQWMFP